MRSADASLHLATILATIFAAIIAWPAAAADCPGNPNALGVSRVLVVDPTEHPLLGALGYDESLPLNDHEVVLTFDDGPLPPQTNHILAALAHECVKATFFMVGRMARAYPSMVKRVAAEGHTIANHSQNHPFTFNRMPVERAAQEIEDGFTSIRTALGDPNGVAPFFRFPGLLHQPAVERYLKAHGIQAWSVDVVADDWTHIKAAEIVRRAMTRLEKHGKGILLLHDIQKQTAIALPMLLAELKAHHFKIVQVVPVGPNRAKTPTTPEQWIIYRHHAPPSFWPEPAIAGLPLSPPELEAPSPKNFGIVDAPGQLVPVAFGPRSKESPPVLWPSNVLIDAPTQIDVLPAPARINFRYSRVWRPTPRSARTTHHMHSHRPVAHSKPRPTTRPSTAQKGASHRAEADDMITNSTRASSAAAASALPHMPVPLTRTVAVRAIGHQIELPERPAAPPPVQAPPARSMSLLERLFR
jgi:peptidoglycan/xylan/chitin deacetylase (PgdA/CDA1 family)